MRCEICERRLPPETRRGTKFCGPTCRSTAYRRRHKAECVLKQPKQRTFEPVAEQSTQSPRPEKASALDADAILGALQAAREHAGGNTLRHRRALEALAQRDLRLAQCAQTIRVHLTGVTDLSQITHALGPLIDHPRLRYVGLAVRPSVQNGCDVALWVALRGKRR